MFSLLSKLLPLGEEARIYHTKGIIDYNALRQMIPGAKELLHYGILTAIDEAKHHPKFGKYSINHQDYFREFKTFIAAKPISEQLSILTTIFKSEGWEANFGGAAWAKITETLASINDSLNNAQTAKKQGNDEEYYDQLMQMTAYMNVLDGLAHNTAPVMEKLIEKEHQVNPNPENFDPEFPDYMPYYRLMDTKELPDEEDVLAEILPILEQSDAPLTMKDWIERGRQRRHQINTPEKEKSRIKKLDAIRKKKREQAMWEECKETYEYKEWVRRVNLPDNKILEYVSSKPFKINILSFIKRLESQRITKLSPESWKLISDLNLYYDVTEEENLSYYQARKYLTTAISLFERLERDTEENFDKAMLAS